MIERKRAAALDAALSAMFRSLEACGIPGHLRSAVEQLDRSESEVRESGRRRRRA